MLSEKEWRDRCEVIWAMHKIMCHFNDEHGYLDWVGNGVPDGTKSVEEVMDTYGNDEDFETDYKYLTRIFCEIIAFRSAYIVCQVADMDFPAKIKLDGNMVII